MLKFVSLRAAAVGSMVFLLLLGSLTVNAQPRTEYRAFWVDTFNTALNTPADVTLVINNAKAAKANALFVQVRRRGDSWYRNTLEPMGDRTPIQAGFDPLADMITKAHAEGIEVHAFVIMSAVWGRAPNLFPPENPNHVFNQHGGFNAATNTISPGPNNWLTRSLIPDGTGGITYQGHRFGSDFWLDFGHPDAAEYTADVVDHLVRNYDIDGLHLDRIRYPEISITGQTPSTGTSVGYNSTSIERFQRYYSIPIGSAPPAQNNPQWNQWRRDQVTNMVRRIYLNALAVKPQLKVSGAYIAFGGIGTAESAWNSAEAYWRVYQDWRAWTQEGITDIAIPMAYKAEHSATVRPQYDQWDAWLRNHLYNRAGMMGQGALSNSIEGTLRQTRRTLTPTGGTNLSGIIYFSMATSNVAVTANPFSVPPGANTPARSFAEFASGLTTGKSVSGATLYEPAGLTPIFAEAAQIPVLPWKVSPTVGHVKGFAKRSDATPLDTADVTITNITTNAVRTGKTDGGGFFGGVDLAPGQYVVKAALGADTVYTCVATISSGVVTTADASPETSAPVTAAVLNPAAPNGENGWYTTDVTLDLSASDGCTGVARTEYSLDGGDTWTAYSGQLSFTSEGIYNVLYRSIDRAGNVESASTATIKIDKTAPTVALSATPDEIWPPNGKMIDVTLAGTGSDAVSGLASATYVVTDEYGNELSIAPRGLNGASASWSEVLAVEARRNGEDIDGRSYRVTITVKDAAGLSSTATTDIVVLHDRRN